MKGRREGNGKSERDQTERERGLLYLEESLAILGLGSIRTHTLHFVLLEGKADVFAASVVHGATSVSWNG